MSEQVEHTVGAGPGLHVADRDRRQAMAQALAGAVRRGELSLHYQPQVDLRNGTMYGVEALLRWHSPEFGAVWPAEFIPVAEQHELIVEIGDWVLRRACEQAAAWRRAGVGHLRVSVNVSAHQLAQGDLARRVQEALLDAGTPPQLLGIEVTETMLVLDAARAARELHALRAIGVQISLDDFGTGYSNLSLLRALPIDVIKIDRSYVDDVTAAPNQVSITRAVIRMAHSLQMKVLAEGVETEGQLALLVSGGCDAMQGHCFSPALEAEAIAELWHARPVFDAPCLQRGGPRQRTVLLVDDEESILASLRRLLRRDGYRILTATSAAEGLLQLAGNEVDVIVSDQRMPHMTGVEFLRRAKQLYPDTVRIVLSGYTELESITAAINEGAIYKFLTKPWEDQLLRANIDEAFRQKAMADENRRLSRQLHDANEELAGLNERLTEALATEHERTQLVETGLGGAVDMLIKLPGALLGVDEFGCVSFVNREAEALWPARPPLLGQDASSALPPALAPLLAEPEDCGRTFENDGVSYHCRIRVLRDGPSCGRLLLITPLASLQEPGS
ncbi:EAL domain-containing protein [Ideonella sp. YS5]|uniref:EAL domain-containing protein n=1 Tax=Ideonella sp. YS5 TaxID=3453714 RepID=UPI003EEB5C2F